MSKEKFKMIPYIFASDLSQEAEQWCRDHDYDTHYADSVVHASEDDGDNPM